MAAFEESHAKALATLLNNNIKNKHYDIVLLAKQLPNEGWYVATPGERIRIFKGDETMLFRLQFGGTALQPNVVIKGHTYDGVLKLINSIESIKAM